MDVIRQEELKGIENPWEETDFVDQITRMKNELQVSTTGDLLGLRSTLHLFS